MDSRTEQKEAQSGAYRSVTVRLDYATLARLTFVRAKKAELDGTAEIPSVSEAIRMAIHLAADALDAVADTEAGHGRKEEQGGSGGQPERTDYSGRGS